MLTMKDIIREGHPTLRLKAKEVNIPLNNEDKNTLKLMMEFIENSIDPEICEEYELRPGVGLAAPQINISKQMIAVKTMDELNETEYVYLMVNPKIISHSIKKTYIDSGEGCLSVDREVEGIVPRHQKITIRSYFYNKDTEELTKKTIKLKGYVGVVVQHEIDHVNGILFVDKLVADLPDAIPVKFAELVFEDTEL
ncbi:MAG: peptide deformylase [Candidatus Izimaplasma sp.]|nr:peptide deformylase [Candidatus Izimaplasma bacterium]